MEELALKIRTEIDEICIGYLFYRQMDVIEKTIHLTTEIQNFLGLFLQGNVFGMENEDYMALSDYVSGVAEDYVEAVKQEDAVLMVDTLEHGVRELLDIYLGPTEESDDGDI